MPARVRVVLCHAIRSVTVVLVALATLSLPIAPAHAAYGPPIPVTMEVYAKGVKLAGAYGSLQFDDGNTKYAYSLAMCRESSYSQPNLWISVNGGPRSLAWSGGGSPVSIPQCRYDAYLISAEVQHGGVVANVAFTLDGVHFSNQNVATYHSRTATFDNPYN
ncbi:hypothetical protein [Nonomuraea sp. NPDC050691]|uniref:hypothetical protein n=1 Tax=Nonomuraea sp. NPDC050691 TaxID=3155661 RepID=UPI0033E88554